jgi:Raf kinase inhibitor-like YbhB/YbcL family protein
MQRRRPTVPFPARLLRSAAVVVVATLVAAACGSSGRALRDPQPGATAPPRKEAPAGTTTTPDRPTEGAFGLASDAWTPGGAIPEQFTCDGANTSPPFAVFGPPAGTVELAVIVTDEDAPFVHWVVAGVAPSAASFDAGEVPPGAVQANNTAGAAQYTGPCPPAGEQHTYAFSVYALSSPTNVAEGQDAVSAVAAITSASTQTGTITGTYRR